jgi:hypothetical protein
MVEHMGDNASKEDKANEISVLQAYPKLCSRTVNKL